MSTPGTERRARNPRGRGDALRGEILEGTRRLLDQRVQVLDLPVSLREVAREVGIAGQSIYLHFSDKDALVRALCADGYERLVAHLEEADAGVAPDAGARTRLGAQARAFTAFAGAERGVFQLMIGSPGQPRPARSLLEHWTALIDALPSLRAGPHTGEQRAALLWAALLGGIVLTTTTFSEDDPTALDGFTSRVVEMVCSSPHVAP